MRVVQRGRRWVGSGVRRPDLKPLLQGLGAYVADVSPSHSLHMAVVRSQHAHARIVRLDLAPARAIPGVRAVFGPADAAGLPDLPILSVVPGQRMHAYPLFYPKALYVGQPLAMVVAHSRYLAEDGAEAVKVEYDPLPAVTSVEEALAPGSPVLHEEWGDNVAAQAVIESGDVRAALDAADFVIEDVFRTPRQMAIPMEPRAIVASYDPRERFLTIWYSTQAPEPFRAYLARAVSLPEDRIRVIAPRIGGGFGNKLHYFPEDVVACVLSVRLGRPVTYVEDRREHFMATVHSRQQTIRVRVGVRRDGTLTGIEAEIHADVGAHLHTKGNAPAWLTARMLPGPYRLEHYRVACRAVVTNKTPHGAYRGFGQPEAVFVHERIMDRVAARLGIDPVDARRRNLLRADEMPYTSAGQLRYDSGDLHALLDAAVDASGYHLLRRRQAEARRNGRFFGVGLAALIEYTGMGPSRLMAAAGNRQGGYETALVRIHPSGAVACYTGIIEVGQGIAAALAQICADSFAVAPESVAVYTGDTHLVPFSFYGTAASRGAAVAGGAVVLACRTLRDKILRLGAHLLKAPLEDVELADGAVRRLGDPRASVALGDVALEAWRAHRLPAGMEPGLEAKAIYDPVNWTFSAQIHVVGCEVDPATGLVRIDTYAVAHDCGTVLNPRLVADQIAGGIAQGLGGALLEEVVYGSDGQLLTTTLIDYLLPTAADTPDVRLVHLETPSPHTPGGMKGVGEGPLIGANVAVVNAVLDALGPAGVHRTAYPLTPETVVSLLQGPTGPTSRDGMR